MEEQNPPTAGRLVKAYVKIRTAKQLYEAEVKAKIREYDEQLDLIEQQLLEICKTTGQDGGRTEHGTFSRSVKTRYWTNDWDSFYKVISEYDAPELLAKSINQSNFKQFIEENPDAMPAGVNVESKYSITVYKPR